MSADQPDVRVRNLTVKYGPEIALRNVNLDICSGCITCILGPSGCGKSTLMKSMLGMIPPASGSVTVLGQRLDTMERDRLSGFLSNVGVTFQHGALFGSRTAGENVAAPLRSRTEMDEDTIRSIVEVKLALVGMEESLHSYPSELSGGQQKRVAIARALALDPALVFFDEPSSGLDPVTADRLDELIQELNESLGATFVIVTHEVRSAVHISDRIVFLYDGQVEESGPVDSVLHSTDENVRQFIAASGVETEKRESASSRGR